MMFHFLMKILCKLKICEQTKMTISFPLTRTIIVYHSKNDKIF